MPQSCERPRLHYPEKWCCFEVKQDSWVSQDRCNWNEKNTQVLTGPSSSSISLVKITGLQAGPVSSDYQNYKKRPTQTPQNYLFFCMDFKKFNTFGTINILPLPRSFPSQKQNLVLQELIQNSIESPCCLVRAPRAPGPSAWCQTNVLAHLIASRRLLTGQLEHTATSMSFARLLRCTSAKGSHLGRVADWPCELQLSNLSWVAVQLLEGWVMIYLC